VGHFPRLPKKCHDSRRTTDINVIHSAMRCGEDRISIAALSSGRDEGWIQLDYGNNVIHDHKIDGETREIIERINSWISYTFNGE
jgi:hypothetical protein